jgi:hypothetical protein
MDMETTGAGNALPQQEASRSSGRPPPIKMASTTNLIQLQSDLEDHIKEKYEFRNIRNGARIITRNGRLFSHEILHGETNNYFVVSPNSEKPMKAVIHHLPPDTPSEDISNYLEDLGFNVSNVRQLTATRRASSGQPHVENLHLFLLP